MLYAIVSISWVLGIAVIAILAATTDLVGFDFTKNQELIAGLTGVIFAVNLFIYGQASSLSNVDSTDLEDDEYVNYASSYIQGWALFFLVLNILAPIVTLLSFYMEIAMVGWVVNAAAYALVALSVGFLPALVNLMRMISAFKAERRRLAHEIDTREKALARLKAGTGHAPVTIEHLDELDEEAKERLRGYTDIGDSN